MRRFGYAVASDPAQAHAALRDPATMGIAGGTELLNWMRLGIAAPDRLVDLGALRAGARPELVGGDLVIPAGTTLATIGEDPLVERHARALAEACLKAASPQIRHRATIGGNVLQKTRCSYFRAETPLPWGCNKREAGSGCAMHGGLDEEAAVFGWTEECVATQPSDPAVALACLDATLELTGASGRRLLPATEFHLTQADAAAEGLDAATAENRLARGELIAAFRIPVADGSSAYVKVRERESYAYAIATAAAAVEARDGRIVRCRVALGSVAQRPWRLGEAERRLAGAALTREEVWPVIVEAIGDARAPSGDTSKARIAAGAALRAILIAGQAS